jgi:hypothetical protein
MDWETKNAIKLAIKSLDDTVFQLHETGEYESNELDEAFRKVEAARTLLKEIV